jgi:transcriptional regulator with XRE-family HTH domain
MDFKDISARMKKTREERDTKDAQPKVMDHNESFLIRAKMIGVLIRDARQNAGRSLEECAGMLRTDPALIEAWEYGDEVPSLPQLELLAYYLDVPISHFWGTTTLEATREDYGSSQREYMALRDRLVGALLRQAREELDLSLEALSEASGLSAEQIEAYEWGEVPLPMHELSVLANVVRKNLNYFLESSSHIGELLAMREMWKHFSNMPEEVRQFAANPLNVGFIEIAIMFSQMPADRLRRVGESVLNISM